MATLSEVRSSIWARLVAGLGTTVRHAPEHPTEQLPVYPAMVVYTRSATWNVEMGATGKIGLASVAAEIHVSRAALGLANAVEALQPFWESVPNAIFMGFQTGATAFTQRFTFGQLEAEMLEGEWAADKTMFIRFVLNDVKVRNNVS